jgi:hypothetical protein
VVVVLVRRDARRGGHLFLSCCRRTAAKAKAAKLEL